MASIKKQIKDWKKYKREIEDYIESWQNKLNASATEGDDDDEDEDDPGSNPGSPPPPPPPIIEP